MSELGWKMRLAFGIVGSSIGLLMAWTDPTCDVMQFGGVVGLVFVWAWAAGLGYLLTPMVFEWMERFSWPFAEEAAAVVSDRTLEA